ncbi:MAG TPA: sarcosine oxidase subunit gamma family protein [Steroidobacteraceae bacterium]|nr:sarcosine oxidase subunit gamma family protein [Steroidobacteraceae bacterium]
MADSARFVLQGGPVAREAAGGAFGVPMPEAACRANTGGGRAALWLGPDERLLLAPEGTQAGVAAALAAALAGIPHSLVDVSERQVAIRVDGPAARDLLATGCPLDLDPEAFPVGACTRTLFAKAEALLWRRAAEEYHLEVGRSFAEYVRGCLRSAQ